MRLFAVLGLCGLMLSVTKQVQGLDSVDFVNLNPAAANQIVIMYRSGEEKSDQVLTAVAEAEKIAKDSGVAGVEKLTWVKCDAQAGENGKKMAEKGLNDLPMVFVAIEGQGMDRYVREMTGEALAEFVTVKLEPTTDEDVFPYSEDLITDAYPVFVKFYEQWCSRCKAAKAAFENAATRMVGRVIFMEVECSASEMTQKFCQKYMVDGYPTFKLLGGQFQQAVPFERDRSVQGFVDFINTNVPEEEEVEEEEEGAEEPKQEL